MVMGTPRGKSILGIKPNTAINAAKSETKAMDKEDVFIKRMRFLASALKAHMKGVRHTSCGYKHVDGKWCQYFKTASLACT
ncbi:hypothetical protein LMORI2_03920 [Limnohabitans sp. MORI2]|nr:hypothetical protein LMORI2_03920 [Limnohabitans sp. MORI2]